LKIDSLSALKNDLNKSVTSTSAQDPDTVNVSQRNVKGILKWKSNSYEVDKTDFSFIIKYICYVQSQYDNS